ncbi:MAG: hypothetical protein HY905_16475 [Deltaproteobacteria bacterium]|nr:hypothetical protein [Deltaproteobacteria bacterium]
MRPSRAPSHKPSQARRTLPVAHVLAALAVVGAGAFYAGYRYGLSRTRPGVAQAKTERASTAPPGKAASDDPHFAPRTVTVRTGNFLENAGFEGGESGWKWLDWSNQWGKFEVAEGRAATGSKAAHLAVHGGATDPGTHVFGVVQELVSPVFPRRISGKYFVERWEPGGARKAYIQVVIIAMRPQGKEPTMQLRYILDGVTEQPYHMSNARYVFVHRRPEPETGEWIDFSLDVVGDYRREWGEVPPDGTGYRVLFEARYDDKPAAATVANDVWYDDLFVGVP